MRSWKYVVHGVSIGDSKGLESALASRAASPGKERGDGGERDVPDALRPRCVDAGTSIALTTSALWVLHRFQVSALGSARL